MQMKHFKTIAQHFSRGFGRVALAPIRQAEPVSNFGMLMLRIDAKADAADLPAVSAQSDCQPQFISILSESKKSSGVLFGIGMSNAQRRRRDFARSDQRQQFA